MSLPNPISADANAAANLAVINDIQRTFLGKLYDHILFRMNAEDIRTLSRIFEQLSNNTSDASFAQLFPTDAIKNCSSLPGRRYTDQGDVDIDCDDPDITVEDRRNYLFSCVPRTASRIAVVFCDRAIPAEDIHSAHPEVVSAVMELVTSTYKYLAARKVSAQPCSV